MGCLEHSLKHLSAAGRPDCRGFWSLQGLVVIQGEDRSNDCLPQLLVVQATGQRVDHQLSQFSA